ncbi:hypothetical protein SAMN05192566_0858 [Methylophilus rhizosphaerae]|uniref:Uncharacterized protein n=1 Tax=Methylophilus rhizosphaerae TaxID=492660 RepID=A0A1G9AWK6_9PROT|nr:hypothetical protein SAMN05192566_0858 [Methylophilus rhizosphaerae]
MGLNNKVPNIIVHIGQGIKYILQMLRCALETLLNRRLPSVNQIISMADRHKKVACR